MKLYTCGEDLLFCIESLMKSNSVYFSSSSFYHYIIYNESATNLKDNYSRNCNEFIDNYFYTIDLFTKYGFYSDDYKCKIATSRFKHLIHYYFSRMLKANLLKMVEEYCLNDEKISEICKFANREKLDLFDRFLFDAIINKRKLKISCILRFKQLYMRFF